MNSIFDLSKSFQKKDDEELFLIFSGKRFYEDNESLLAGRELRKRNFDSDKINAVLVKRLQRVKEQTSEIENLRFINSKQFENMIFTVLGILPFVYFTVQKSIDENLDSSFLVIVLSVAIVVALIPALFARKRFEKSKERKLKNIEKTIELLKSI